MLSKEEKLMTSITHHFEIHKNCTKSRGVYFWSLIKSSNRKIVWQSEVYTTKQNAQIPINKLINIIGKRRTTLKFIDHTIG